jgi:hypothetical protein
VIKSLTCEEIRSSHSIQGGGLNGAVINNPDCHPEGAGFDSRVMLGFFPVRQKINLIKEANNVQKFRKEEP